jgi:hypothetical protein
VRTLGGHAGSTDHPMGSAPAFSADMSQPAVNQTATLLSAATTRRSAINSLAKV